MAAWVLAAVFRVLAGSHHHRPSKVLSNSHRNPTLAIDEESKRHGALSRLIWQSSFQEILPASQPVPDVCVAAIGENLAG